MLSDRVLSDRKVKLDQIKDHPSLSKILKRSRIVDSSDDSKNCSVGTNDLSGQNLISNSSILITPIIKLSNPPASLTNLLSQSSTLIISTKPPLNITVDFPNILTSFSPLVNMDPQGEPATLKLPVPVDLDPSISKLAGRHPEIDDPG